MNASFDPLPPEDDDAHEWTQNEPAQNETPQIVPVIDEPAASPVPPAGNESYLEGYARPLPPMRIPTIVDVVILLVVLLVSSLVSFGLFSHFLHISPSRIDTNLQTSRDIAFMFGGQAGTYFLSFAFWFMVFPLLWHQGFFTGVQWRASAAISRRWLLLGAAFACLLLAFVDALLIPGPENAPIDQVFQVPGAAWLMFAFGTTLAPFIEEMAFRGFLLPALATAWDWSTEQIQHRPAPWPDPERGTLWSPTAMIVGSVVTSIPFAWMHAEQTGYSIGPFLLLFCVSLVLCWVRLSTRSLAASTMVHACYNLLLFSLMLLGTGGFRHMDKM